MRPHSRNGLRRMTQRFLTQRLSAAGVVDMLASQRRRLWKLFMACVMAGLLYVNYKVVAEYLEYPISVETESVMRTRLKFPAVTICSLNPIHGNVYPVMHREFKRLRDEIKKMKTLEADPASEKDCTNFPMCLWSWFTQRCSCVRSPCEVESCFKEIQGRCNCAPNVCQSVHSCESFNDNCMCNNTEIEVKLDESRLPIPKLELLKKDVPLKKLLQLIRNSKTDDLRDVEEFLLPQFNAFKLNGETLDKLILSCSFEDEPCDKPDFTAIYHAKYGRCFEFNYDASRTGHVKKVKNYGSGSGLHLLLRIEPSEASTLLTRQRGVRAVIHDPHQLPHIDEDGFDVRVNDMTSAEVSAGIYQRRGSPWSPCIYDYNLTGYNDKECVKNCRLEQVQTACGCTKKMFLGAISVEDKFWEYENTCSEEDGKCVEKILQELDEGKLTCDCQPNCFDWGYTVRLSSSNINERFFHTVRAIKSLRTEGNITSSANGFSDKSFDMVSIKVYYKSLEVLYSIEVPIYSSNSLMANIAGNLGFFMGLSLITFLQIAEFTSDLILWFFKTVFKRKSSKKGIRKVNRIRDCATEQSDFM